MVLLSVKYAELFPQSWAKVSANKVNSFQYFAYCRLSLRAKEYYIGSLNELLDKFLGVLLISHASVQVSYPPVVLPLWAVPYLLAFTFCCDLITYGIKYTELSLGLHYQFEFA
jgi:hypothetical protein